MTVQQAVVLDQGTGIVKAGFAGQLEPCLVFDNVIAKSLKRQNGSLPGPAMPASVVGFDGLDLESGLYDAHYPMRNGIVQNWQDMQQIWDFTWKELNIQPQECKLMLTDPALNPTANKQKILEVMLEHYGFAGVSMQVQAVLSLYAQGTTTGVVLDSGDGVSHAVAVVDGFAFTHLTQRLELAGRHVTEHLMELLLRRGAPLHRTHDLAYVRRIKEKCCYVAPDFERETKLAKETTCLNKTYTLPDGRMIKIGPERFQAPEVLFRPALLNMEKPGLAAMIFNAINDCDIDNRRQLYEQIVISGGTTMFPGLSSRLESEVRSLYKNNVVQGDVSRAKALKINVRDGTERHNMVFKGASFLADMLQDHNPEGWITLPDWQEDPYRCMRKLGIVSQPSNASSTAPAPMII